jgi:hypothetical protein
MATHDRRKVLSSSSSRCLSPTSSRTTTEGTGNAREQWESTD